MVILTDKENIYDILQLSHIKSAIKFLKHLKEKENIFNPHFWKSNIYNKNTYNFFDFIIINLRYLSCNKSILFGVLMNIKNVESLFLIVIPLLSCDHSI